MQRAKKKMKESDSNKLLHLISENEGLSIQEISEKLGWTKSKIDRTLNTMERNGWIVKRVFSAAQPMIAKSDERYQRLANKFTKLVAWKDKLHAREKDLFGKCVSAQIEGDSEKAKMYANQCAELREIIRLVSATAETVSKLSAAQSC